MLETLQATAAPGLGIAPLAPLALPPLMRPLLVILTASCLAQLAAGQPPACGLLRLCPGAVPPPLAHLHGRQQGSFFVS